MKATLLQTAVQNGAKRIPMALVVAVAMTFLHQDAAAITPINYGDASSFSVLAGTGIGNTGSGTTIGQNVGVSPYAGTFITGLTPIQVGGTIYAVDSSGPAGVAGNNPGKVGNAMSAFGAAFTAAAGETPTSPNTLLQLGGQTLIPGVYTFNTIDTVLLNGTLMLNGNGQAHPVWIFQMTRDITTGSGSSIVFENGGIPCDVLWEVPTQATLGSDSTFVGTIMAGTSIVMNNGATLDGRAWADAAVTLNNNNITGLPCTSISDTGDTGGTGGTGGTTVPDTGSTLPLLGLGVLSLLAFLKARGRSLGLTQNRRAIS
jgi:hypothetical protein